MSVMVEPIISVIMPVWNRQRYVAQAIQSVLDQTFGDFELIVIDDGSTDRSRTIVRQLAVGDERIRLIEQANAGCYAARNRGLAEARGRYMAVLDSDDIALPRRFERQVAYLDAHAECAAVGSWLTFTDPFGVPNQTVELPSDHDAIDQRHMAGHPGALVHGAAMCRMSHMRDIGGYRQTPCAADYDLFLRLAEVGTLANLSEVLTHVRTHIGSISTARRHEQIERALAFVAEARQRRGLTEQSAPRLAAERLPGGGARDAETIPLNEESPSHRRARLAEQARSWALHAIAAGRLSIARRHALRLLRQSPYSLQSWRIMRWALRG